MTAYYRRHGITVHHGDCLDIMRTLPDASVHAVVCDPPYELAFMAKNWDNSGVAFDPDTWRECLRVLTPGGHLLAFGGSRTWHRLAVAVEDAGFEVRDSIAWMFGAGFPKSRNHLKPGFEPIVLARRPFAGTVAATMLEHGTGALNIGGCRVAGDTLNARRNKGTGMGYHGADGDRGAFDCSTTGRWPSNVVLTHAADCGPQCIDRCPVGELDQQSGTLASGKMRGGVQRSNRSGWAGDLPGQTGAETYGDTGGASRFFPSFRWEAKAPATERPRINSTSHPTVKPLALMRWLCRLVTPPHGIVLDPFAGSGTTLQAARAEGFHAIGIERESDYLPLIQARLDGREEVMTTTGSAAALPHDLLDLIAEEGSA